jgi:hypothetical protein
MEAAAAAAAVGEVAVAARGCVEGSAMAWAFAAAQFGWWLAMGRGWPVVSRWWRRAASVGVLVVVDAMKKVSSG